MKKRYYLAAEHVNKCYGFNDNKLKPVLKAFFFFFFSSGGRKTKYFEKLPVTLTHFPHSPVDGIHPIAVCGSYKDPLDVCEDGHELPPADWNISAMQRERFWFQHNFFSMHFRRLQVNSAFWSVDSQITSSLKRDITDLHM